MNHSNISGGFEDFYRWDTIKTASVSAQLAVVLVGPCVLGSIIWYERHGAQTPQSTIIHLFVTIICLSHIMVHVPALIAHITG